MTRQGLEDRTTWAYLNHALNKNITVSPGMFIYNIAAEHKTTAGYLLHPMLELTDGYVFAYPALHGTNQSET